MSVDVLVVDDDPLVLMNYMDILVDEGYNPIGAENLAQALNKLQSRTFDIIVCDHDLTDGKGSQLVEQIIADSRTEPVIYLSAALPSVLEQVSNMPPVKKVLAKPVSPEYLLEAVNEYKNNAAEAKNYPRLIGDEERRILLEGF